MTQPVLLSQTAAITHVNRGTSLSAKPFNAPTPHELLRMRECRFRGLGQSITVSFIKRYSWETVVNGHDGSVHLHFVNFAAT